MTSIPYDIHGCDLPQTLNEQVSDDIVTYTVMFYIHINIHWYLWWPYEPSVVRQMNTYDMMCQLLGMIVMMIWYIQWWGDMLHTLYNNDDMMIYNDDTQ